MRASLNPGDVCASFGSPQGAYYHALSLLKTAAMVGWSLEVLACTAK